MKFKNAYTIVIIVNIVSTLCFVTAGTLNLLDFNFSVSAFLYAVAILNAIILGVNIEKALSEQSYIEFLENIEEHRGNFLKAMEMMNKEEQPFEEFNGEVPFPEVKNKNEKNIK